MDWKKIKEKYYLSYHYLLSEWVFEWHYKSARDLYDFFDENEIYITITADYYGINEHNPLSFSGSKEDVYYWFNVDWRYEDDIEYKTRAEAESVAFEKAFSILEEKLGKSD